MSADNYILIDRKTFEVYEGCASTDHKSLIGKGKNLEEAVDIAQKYRVEVEIDGSYIEYGINFTNVEEKLNE